MPTTFRVLSGIAALVAIAASGVCVGWLVAGGGPSASGTRGGDVAAPDKPQRPSVATDGPRELAGATNPDLTSNLPQPRFVDVSAARGIHFLYVRGETGDFWLPETMGGGVAWLDYDGDGLEDLYFVQGCQLPPDRSDSHVNVLYRNMGNDTWQQVPPSAAPSDAGYGMGVAAADVDNDGFDDVYVTNYGPDAFYWNHGDGTFTEATEATGLGCALWGTSAAFGDLDRDGNLDLVVGNYIQFDPAIQCRDPETNRRKYCGPDYYAGQPNRLYHNDGAGRFADISEAAGVARGDGKTLGVVIADLVNSDGWPEIFAANDLVDNFLFENRGGQGTQRFEEIGLAAGAARNDEGIREANMGIACGDYDANGQLDLYVTHYFMEHDTLWQNLGSGFRDVTKAAGLGLATLRQLSWGTNFLDFDNDGWLDLFVSSGHINNYGSGSTTPYAMRPQLFFNAGGRRQPARFHEVSDRAGAYFADRYVGRGSAAADFDRDGRVDLAVTHHHRPAAVLHNESPGSGHGIGLRLVGKQSGRSGVGVRVVLEFAEPGGAERRLVREVLGGGSYLSADSRELLVGTGAAERVRNVEVHWPSGIVDRYADLSVGGYWTIREAERATRFAPFHSD